MDLATHKRRRSAKLALSATAVAVALAAALLPLVPTRAALAIDYFLDLVLGGGSPAVSTGTVDASRTTVDDVVADAIRTFTPQVEGLERMGATVGDFKAAVARVTADPYYNYVAGYRYTYRENAAAVEDCTLSAFELEFSIACAGATEYDRAMGAAVARLTDSVPQDASDFDRARYAHDYLVILCSFDGGASDASHTAYGALVNGGAANRGYAYALSVLLQALGVESAVVESVETGVPWNMVCVDGAWYHVDVAWDDQGDDQRPSYQYFLRGDESFARSHDAWVSAQPAPLDYAATLIGTTSQDRVAYAKELWRRAIESGAEELAGVEFYAITMDEAYQAFDELMQDPWYDYVAEHGVVYYQDAPDQGGCTVASFTLGYRLSLEQIAGYRSAMEAAVQAALDQFAWAQTDYDKVLAVHDYLVRTCAYNESPVSESYTAYGALVLGSAVCQGYADAYKLLLGMLGVECTCVSSTVMEHGWNMVCVDGAWYHVDVTWDDPTPDRGADAEVSYVHFLRSDDVMLELGHHGWESAHAAPYDYWL